MKINIIIVYEYFLGSLSLLFYYTTGFTLSFEFLWFSCVFFNSPGNFLILLDSQNIFHYARIHGKLKHTKFIYLLRNLITLIYLLWVRVHGKEYV